MKTYFCILFLSCNLILFYRNYAFNCIDMNGRLLISWCLNTDFEISKESKIFMQKGKTEETCITEFVIKLFPLTKRKKEIVSVNYFTTTTKRILGIHWNCILKATIQLLIQFNFLYDLKNSFGLWKNFDLKKKMIF